MDKTIALPLENLPIIFDTIEGQVHSGTYVAEEQMFYVGFKDGGDFKFIWEVETWEYIMQ
tara:strand:- start:562 stop:741 length:180 start_codon:yes stop_codon:yes gene_type:complete